MKIPGRRSNGFTLAEALIAFALLSVCLAVVANIFASGRRAMLFEETGLEAVRTARLCLETLRADVEQADPSKISGSESGGAGLTLERTDPALAIRGLPLPLSAATASPQLPRTITVRWRYDDDQHALIRETEAAGGAKSVVRIGRRVVRFWVRYEKDAPASPVTVDLTVQGSQGVREQTRDLSFRDTIHPLVFVPEVR